jgi:hypothetical protein
VIQLPRRSVTRFFIPLIDVLLLLFCIFLLMPLVKGGNETPADETPAAREERLRRLEEEAERMRRQARETPQELRDELEKLRREKLKTLQEKLAFRVLEIDPATGRLYYYAPERVEISTQAKASELIAEDRARQADRKSEVYYLILYPRDPSSPYPLREQRERYDRWFADVAHGWDVPGGPSVKGTNP